MNPWFRWVTSILSAISAISAVNRLRVSRLCDPPGFRISTGYTNRRIMIFMVKHFDKAGIRFLGANSRIEVVMRWLFFTTPQGNPRSILTRSAGVRHTTHDIPGHRSGLRFAEQHSRMLRKFVVCGVMSLFVGCSSDQGAREVPVSKREAPGSPVDPKAPTRPPSGIATH